MSYIMGDIIKIFKTHFVLLFILICFPVSRCTNTSTVCYGPVGPTCTTHRLSCTSPLVIQIINTTYGYRSGCNNLIGLTQCSNITCCKEEPGDCFIPFSSDEHQQVLGNCSGVETCTMSLFRQVSGRNCSNTISAYSKIQYDCVTKGSIITTSTLTSYIQTTITIPTDLKTIAPTTTSKVTSYKTSTEKYSADLTSTSSTMQSDSSGVVGGVLGTLLIISVIINVGLVVYIIRKMKSLSSTPRENNYDGITNTGRDQTLPSYDVLQVQSVTSSDDRKKSDSIHTYYNTKGDSLSRDIDPYYENMKKPGS